MCAFWTDLTDTFSNRELATGFWILIAFLACLSGKSIRSSMYQVLKAGLNWKLFVLFGSFGLWAFCLSRLYRQIGLWDDDQVFATLFWTALNGFPLLGRSLNTAEGDQYFKKILRDNFKLIGLFEFIVVAYSFSLFAELVVVPMLAFLGMLLVVAQMKDEYHTVQRLLEFVLTAFVLYVVFLQISEIVDQPESFWMIATGRNFALPIIFSIGSIPLIYVWFCFSHLEHANLAINQKTFQNDELKAYARRRFFLIFVARPWLLKRAVRQFHTLPAKDKADVDRIIQGIYTYEREAEAPPPIDEAEGWSPYLAREFLAQVGLRTSDFHDSGYDGEWFAASPYVDLDERLLPNKAVFYIEGREGVIERVKLSGKFLDEFDLEEAHHRLRQFELLLTQKALFQTEDQAAETLPNEREYTVQAGSTLIERHEERYPNGRGYETFYTMTRGKGALDTN